jgi:hypothetical protein
VGRAQRPAGLAHRLRRPPGPGTLALALGAAPDRLWACALRR